MIEACTSSQEEPEDTFWQDCGNAVFGVSAIFAFVSVAGTWGNKRKVYVMLPSPTQGEPIIATVEQEVPQATDEEKEKIREIFKTVAEKGVGLVLEKNRLEQLGKEIEHVHPFALMETVPKHHMRAIFASKNPFKTKNVIDGIAKGILREIEADNLHCYTARFAAKFGKSKVKIQNLINYRQWRPLVNYIYDI